MTKQRKAPPAPGSTLAIVWGAVAQLAGQSARIDDVAEIADLPPTTVCHCIAKLIRLRILRREGRGRLKVLRPPPVAPPRSAAVTRGWQYTPEQIKRMMAGR